MQIFQDIEEAVYNQLKSEIFDIGVKTLDFYTGQIDSSEIEDLLDTIYQFPFVYIVSGNLDLSFDNQRDKCKIVCNLIIGDRNMRGYSALRTGDQSSPGVYAVMQKCFELLHGQKLVADTYPIILQRIYPYISLEKQSVCIFIQEYSTTYNLKRI